MKNEKGRVYLLVKVVFICHESIKVINLLCVIRAKTLIEKIKDIFKNANHVR